MKRIPAEIKYEESTPYRGNEVKIDISYEERVQTEEIPRKIESNACKEGLRKGVAVVDRRMREICVGGRDVESPQLARLPTMRTPEASIWQESR